MANNTTPQMGISTLEQNAILKRAYIEQDDIIKQLQQEKTELEKELKECQICLKDMLDMNIDECNAQHDLIEWLEEEIQNNEDNIKEANDEYDDRWALKEIYCYEQVLNKIKGE